MNHCHLCTTPTNCGPFHGLRRHILRFHKVFIDKDKEEVQKEKEVIMIKKNKKSFEALVVDIKWQMTYMMGMSVVLKQKMNLMPVKMEVTQKINLMLVKMEMIKKMNLMLVKMEVKLENKIGWQMTYMMGMSVVLKPKINLMPVKMKVIQIMQMTMMLVSLTV